MALSDAIKKEQSEANPEDVPFRIHADLQRRHAGSKAELAVSKTMLTEAEKELTELRRIVGYMETARATPAAPTWTYSPGRAHRTGFIACGILSDLHLDEVVRAEEVEFLNAYNRKIAVMRLKRWAKVFIRKALSQEGKCTGIIICLGGDLFSGIIHDELRDTNEDGPFGTVLFYRDVLVSVLRAVANELNVPVYVPCVVGNHGRLDRKPRFKLAARHNMDWLFSHMVADALKDDKRFTFNIPESSDCKFPAYDVNHVLSHGNQTNGGGGIGGIWPPIMRMRALKQGRKPFDVMVIGHWHQLINAPEAGLVINGSLKGYDEYAIAHNFRPERAGQAMWICVPKYGAVDKYNIWCDDPIAEGWERAAA